MSHSVVTASHRDVLTISSKGWVVIPAEYRKKYDLRPGTSVTIVDYGGVLAIVPILPDPVHSARGLLAGATSLTNALLAERHQEQVRE